MKILYPIINRIDQIDHKQNCQPNCMGNWGCIEKFFSYDLRFLLTEMYTLFILCDQLLLTHPNVTTKLLNCVLDTVEERFGVSKFLS